MLKLNINNQLKLAAPTVGIFAAFLTAINIQGSVFPIPIVIGLGMLVPIFFYFYVARIMAYVEKIHKKQSIEIIHRRYAEAQLSEAKDRAEAANRHKSIFMANVTHELRTPMNAILGFSDLLREEGLNDGQLDYVQMIHNSGSHLLSLINNVLDVSKIEAGKERIDKEMCSLRPILDQVEMLMRNSAESKGLCFEVDICEELPEQIFIDATHLSQCLINLVGNAVKFTEQGSVTLRAGLLDSDTDPWVYFEVSDTGIGIPPDRLDKVFESFEQADVNTSIKYGGTGLGLAISQNLTEMMGGSLSVESEQGVGSKFTIKLPVEVAGPATVSSRP